MPRLIRPHRAPLLWLVLPFCGGLIAARMGLPLSRAAALETGIAAALGAITAALGNGCRGTSAKSACSTSRPGAAPEALSLPERWWAGSLLCALACAGFAIGRAADAERELAASRWFAPGMQTVTLQIVHLGAPRPQGPQLRSVSGTGVLRTTRPASMHRFRGSVAAILRLRSEGESRVAFRLLLRPGEHLPPNAATVELNGAFHPFSQRGGPDSYAGYLRSQGVALELSPAWLRRTVAPPPWLAERFEALAERLSALLRQGFDRRPDLGALYQAMMLGRKAELSPGQLALFAASGTQHLFAINGLHLGLVALSCHALLKLLRCPRPAAAAVVLAVLWVDVQSTGASPSAQRAWVMAAAVEAAHACRLPINPLAALTVAAAALLAREPGALFSASFQMSCSVVAGLILLGAPYAGWLQRRYCAYPHEAAQQLTLTQQIRAAAQRHLLGALGFGAAAAAVSAVTGVEYFGRFAPSGLLANLLLMPLATLVIVAGCAAVVSGLLHLGAAALVFNSAARLLLQAIVAALQAIVQLPGASWSLHYRAPWVGPLALAALLATCLWGYAHRWRPAQGGWPPPFLVAAGALLLGAKSAPAARHAGGQALRPWGISRLASAVDQTGPPRFSREMKSAYELAMERLAKSDPSAPRPLDAAKKAKLAEIDRVYQGKLAEREIFLKQQLESARVEAKADELEKIQKQIASERARLEEEREEEKERVRRS